jgi:aminoglycoside/choline kinase family phosphotransferase
VLPPYDDALLSRELSLFPDWYVAKHRKLPLDTGLQDKLNVHLRTDQGQQPEFAGRRAGVRAP